MIGSCSVKARGCVHVWCVCLCARVCVWVCVFAVFDPRKSELCFAVLFFLLPLLK